MATRFAGRDLAVLYGSMLISRVGFGVIIIIFPLYIAKSSDITVAVALALYPIFEAAASLPLGRVCDRSGRKRVMMSALGAMAVLMAAIGLTRDVYAIGLIHAMMGVAAAGVTVSSLTMITDLAGGRSLGTGMGTFDFANIGGYAVGLFLGGRLDAAYGSKLGDAFFITSLAVAAAFVVGLLVVREPEHPRGEGRASLNPLRALDPRSRAILPIWLSVTMLVGVVFFLPRALAEIGLAGSTTANLLFVGVLALGVGSIGFGALSDVIGRAKVIIIGSVGLMGLLGTVGYSFHEGMRGITRNFPVIGVFAILTAALIPSILATAGDRAGAGARGQTMGLYSVMLSAGTAVGTLIAGEAHSIGGLSGIFYAGAFLFGAACIVSGLLWYLATSGETVRPI